ncbi:MAG TPA: hypothetical protein VGN63_11970 [Flavisolibacter sp.]|nr:hypothetical protein [Flavisolibacter sp.]
MNIFLDNDTLGVCQLPGMGLFSGRKAKDQTIEILKAYCADHKAVIQKLEEEDLPLNNKLMLELVSEYLGKELTK